MADGGATTVGQIIGYLILNRADWDRGVRDTKRDAGDLGRLSPDIRIQTNAGVIIAQLGAVRAAERGIGTDAKAAEKPVIGLLGALLALAPAGIPIAGVLGGAMIGLLPVVAALGLGVLGLSENFKAGRYEGTQFGADINTVRGFLTQLKQTASSGMLSGLDQAIHGSRPLFKLINDDVGLMSAELGSIVANIVPALLSILTQLNPLFVTFGSLVARGAKELNNWSHSTTGVSSFVAYVQSELPAVLGFLGELLVLFGHIAQAAAPMGGVILNGLGTLVHVLNSLPIGTLQILVPLLTAAYAAFKTYAGITYLIALVNSALEGHQARVAQTAATVAIAEAEKAEAAAASARLRESLVAGVNSALASEARTATLRAEEVAAAEALKADAARASADKVKVATRTSAASWTAALGPIGALAVGVGILGTAFLHSGESAQESAANINTLADAVKADSGAISDNVRLTALDILQKKGATNAARTLGISINDLVDASLGNADAQKRVNAAMDEASDKIDDMAKDVDTAYASSSDLSKAWDKVHGALKDTSGDLDKAITKYKDYTAIQKENVQTTNASMVAAAALYNLHGDQGVSAYLAARQAAEQNTAQTKQQTLAFQLENNAVALVNQALQSLAGQNLSAQQAQTNLDSAILNTIQTLKDNKGSMDELTAAGVANRQSIEQTVSALQAKLQADAASTGSTEQATAAYNASVTAILARIAAADGDVVANNKTQTAMNESKDKAYQYAQQLLKIPPVVKTKADLDNDQARAQARALAAYYRATLGAVHIDALISERVTVSGGGSGRGSAGVAGAFARGGEVPGTGNKDDVLIAATPREWVVPVGPSQKYRAFLQAITAGSEPLMAIRAAPSVNSPAAAASSQSTADRGASSDGAGALVVYVQNPWTGEYMRAQVAAVADQRLGVAAREMQLVGGRS